MKACYYKTTYNDVIVCYIIGETKEDDEFYSFDSNEKWNGEYYKGWRSDRDGIPYSFDNRTYKIEPLYNDNEGFDYDVTIL